MGVADWIAANALAAAGLAAAPGSPARLEAPVHRDTGRCRRAVVPEAR